jgi:hypothetical protein
LSGTTVTVNSGERVDVKVLTSMGVFSALSLSLKYGRPRWPYCSHHWCPGNRAYLVDAGVYAPATTPLEYTARVRTYSKPANGASLEPLPAAEPKLPITLQPSKVEDASDRFHVVIVGGGLSAFKAAAEAASYGLRVLLVIGSGKPGVNMELWGDRFSEVHEKVKSSSEVTVAENSFYAGVYDEGHAIISKDSLLVYTDRKPLIYATAFTSSPPLAENNDLPGLLAAEYVLELLSLGYKPKRIAIIGCSYVGRKLAEHAVGEGIETIVVKPGWLKDKCEMPEKASIIEARELRFQGRERLEAIEADGETLPVDLVASALPPLPDAQLPYAMGYHMLYCRGGIVAPNLPGADVEELRRHSFVIPAGESLGEIEPGALEASAAYAAALAAAVHGKATLEDVKAALQEYARVSGRGECGEDAIVERPPQLFSEEIHGFKFVDFEEDVTLEMLINTWRLGYHSLEMIKRITGLGMGLDQGRIGIPLSLIAISYFEKVPIGRTEYPKPRPPFSVMHPGMFVRLEV